MNERQQQQLEMTRDYLERLRREHPLRDLFWECTLRCNMACRHCGSDCLKESMVPDMPFADFLPVLGWSGPTCWTVGERYVNGASCGDLSPMASFWTAL